MKNISLVRFGIFLLLALNISLSYALQLTITNSDVTQNLYRGFFGPAGVPTDFYVPDSVTNPDVAGGILIPFNGWEAQITPGSLYAALVITPTGSPAACTFQSMAQYPQSIFAVDVSNSKLVLNPDIPREYFNPANDKPPLTPLTCSASVKAVAFVNGVKQESNSVTIKATINPIPPSAQGDHYIKIENTGALDNLAPRDNYFLPISINSNYAPLTSPERPPCSSIDPNCNKGLIGGKEIDVFRVKAGDDPNKPLIISVGQTYNYGTKDNCYLFGTFDPAQQFLTININDLATATSIENAYPIKITWNAICPTNKTNEGDTVSGGVNTKNRFQYGTFQVKMIPSGESGVNSSFYTFFGDGKIRQTVSGENPVPPTDYYNWGYTWHEIDFEFVPGTHEQDMAPNYSPSGFSSAFLPKDKIGNTASLNAFSPGNAIKNLFGSLQHHRYCPNSNDTECSPAANINPFDGAAHVFTFTWDKKEIKYYMDGILTSTLPIVDKQDGTPSYTDNGINVAQQVLFNDASMTDVYNKNHPTSPQFISMNFWVPTNRDNFGGNFDYEKLNKDDKIYTVYKYVTWSPCVADGKITTDCPQDGKVGQVYDSAGNLLANEDQKVYEWDFTSMNKATFLQDWMYAPLMGFDSNNSKFVQNGVLFDKEGLKLCMMKLWPNMATTGIESTGCDGNMILPSPGENSSTNFNTALLVITAQNKAGASLPWGNLGTTYGGIAPLVPNDDSHALSLFNNGWDNPPDSDNSCNNEYAKEYYTCGSSNGWFADSRVEKMSNGNYEATQLFYLNTESAGGKPWTLKPSGKVGNGCSVTYEPETITLEAQKTYFIKAYVDCPSS